MYSLYKCVSEARPGCLTAGDGVRCVGVFSMQFLRLYFLNGIKGINPNLAFLKST